MFEKTKEENVIILFDEQGTPTFRNRETDIFLGIAVLYKIENESSIFNICKNELGLVNSKPLKNYKISAQRAQKISEILIQLNLDILFASMNLCNTELQQVVTLYEEFGNTLRKYHRNVGERHLNHILHKEIFDFVIYNIVNNYIDKHPYPYQIKFSVYLDNWSFPVNDISIELEESSKKFEQKINEINEQYFPQALVRFDNYKLLDVDSPRKRFIDVIASIISRKFLEKNNPKYFNNVQLDAKITKTDITSSTIEDIKMYMDKLSRESLFNYTK